MPDPRMLQLVRKQAQDATAVAPPHERKPSWLEALMIRLNQPSTMLRDMAHGKIDKDMLINMASNVDMTAYHGTPHVFDKFDIKKIGTGEGAQSYGHGLYFAGKPETAQYYQGALAGKDILHNGVKIGQRHGGSFRYEWGEDVPSDIIAAAKEVERYGSHPEAVKAVQSRLEGTRHYAPDQAALASHTLDALEKVKDGEITTRPAGALYTVDIPEDHTMLHWDLPLSQQPDVVKKALEPYRLPDVATGAQVYDMLKNRAMSAQEPGMRRGLETYAPDASNTLKESGVTGIKYLDGGSRASGEGSHNYVVFDDKHVKILDRK